MSSQPPPEPPDDPLVGVELNGYQIRSVMAEGGMGKVYLGVHPLVGAKAAIKVMLPQFADDKDQADRFVREARVLATLNHDRIVKIMGFGTLPDGRQYMITEHLEGASLSRIVEREAPMSPAKALNLLDQMLDALSAAHAAGVVHRDLKPANVIVKAVGTERKLKLLDFGLARARVIPASVDPSMPLNKASQVMGTPEYMAPEQARGFAPTPASDLYSVGVMAFELLTHRLPFLANNVFEMMKHHVNTTPPRVGVLVPAVPPALEDLVAQLLSKTPEDRGAPAERVRKVVQALIRELPPPENPARKMTTGEFKLVQRPGGGAPIMTEVSRGAAGSSGAPITAEPSRRHAVPPGAPISAEPSRRHAVPTGAPISAEPSRRQPSMQGPVVSAEVSRRPSNPQAPAATSEASRRNAMSQGPVVSAEASRRPSNPQATAALSGEVPRAPGNTPLGPPSVTPPPMARVDPAYAAAREKAQLQAPQRSGLGRGIAYVLGLSVAVLVGMSFERYNAAHRVPEGPSLAAKQQTAPVVPTGPAAVVEEQPTAAIDAGAAPEPVVEAATPEVRDPKELCKNVPNWRSELLDNVKTMRNLYLTTHPGSMPDKPPLSKLAHLRDLGVAAADAATCEKIQKGIDSWEMQNLKGK